MDLTCRSPQCIPSPNQRQQWRLPCDTRTIDCVLFRKQAFEVKQTRLRALVGQNPTSVSARLSWMKQVVALVDGALLDTNIRPEWILGGVAVPVDIQATARVESLPAPLWPGTRALLAEWQIAAALRCEPFATIPVGSRFYHDPYSFMSNVRRCTRGGAAAEGGSGARATPVGTRGLGFMGEAPGAKYTSAEVPAYDKDIVGWSIGEKIVWEANYASGNQVLLNVTPLNDALMRRLSASGKVHSWPHAGSWGDLNIQRYASRDTVLKAYLETYPGAGLHSARIEARQPVARLEPVAASQRREGGGYAYSVPLVGGADWVRYYKAVATDVINAAFETYVLVGLELWSTNLQSWASRGHLALPPETFRETAQAASQARTRAGTQMGYAMVGGIASAANPLAGAIVGILGSLTDVLIQATGIGTGHFWPRPLTVRSATGDCDFSQLIGSEAAERTARQRSGLDLYFGQDNEGADEASTSIPSISKPVLVGGALLVAGAAAYFLLR